MLMYPTLAVALVGAVPQYSSWVTAAAKGLPLLGDAKYARQESDKAWDRNLDCLTNIEHIKPNANTKYGIDLVPCPSGDILVTLTPLQSPGTHISRWIVTTDFFSDIAQFSLVGTATAQESSTGSPEWRSSRPPSPAQARTVSGLKCRQAVSGEEEMESGG